MMLVMVKKHDCQNLWTGSTPLAFCSQEEISIDIWYSVYSRSFLTKQTLLLVCTFLYLVLTTHLNLSNSEAIYIGLDVSYANMPLTSHLFTHGIIEKHGCPFPGTKSLQNQVLRACLIWNQPAMVKMATFHLLSNMEHGHYICVQDPSSIYTCIYLHLFDSKYIVLF